MAFVELIALDRCHPGAGTFVGHGGWELAVFRLTDPQRVVVTDNSCPHSAGNLSRGEVNGGIVTCPWHKWKFDLDRGVCTRSARVRLRQYRSEIRDGTVWVDLPEADHSSAASAG